MVASVILAAGESRRFGSPKQLALLEGQSLIARAVSTAVDAGFVDVFIVTGAFADRVTAELTAWRNVRVIHNPQWHEGKASSIRAGLEAAVSRQSGLTGVLIATCDQPWITWELLQSMLHRHRVSPEHIVACEYSGTIGSPMLVPRIYFAELLKLTGEQGARVVAEAHANEVERVPFAEGARDIDTVSDLEHYRSENATVQGQRLWSPDDNKI
jgi:molybdenum cofactor cytidylyltransferase